MGRSVFAVSHWDYSVCLCPIKMTPGLYALILENTVISISNYSKKEFCLRLAHFNTMPPKNRKDNDQPRKTSVNNWLLLRYLR